MVATTITKEDGVFARCLLSDARAIALPVRSGVTALEPPGQHARPIFGMLAVAMPGCRGME